MAEATVAGIIGTSQRVPSARYNAMIAAMKAKYGEVAEVWLNPTNMVAKVGGEVVETRALNAQFYQAVGLTLAGPVGSDKLAVFPFEVGADTAEVPAGNREIVEEIQQRFSRAVKAEYLKIAATDFAIRDCHVLSPDELGLGLSATLLRLRNTTLCTVESRRAPRASMLMGLTLTGGGFWIRPLSLGACRLLSKAWLARVRAAPAAELPDYLQCMLVDRPTFRASAISTVVYLVRKDGTLAIAR
jgi:hypothetical protein